MSEIITSLFR